MKVGDVLNTKYGKCTIVNIKIKESPRKSTRYDVKFEDGEYCRFAKWQIAEILLP